MRTGIIFKIVASLVLAGWAAWLATGEWLSEKLEARFGTKLILASNGKIPDAGIFIQERFYDLLWLASSALLLIMVAKVIGYWLLRKKRELGWVFQSVLVFVLVNIWVFLAGGKVLFWSVLRTSEDAKYASFQFKKTLMAENRTPLLGMLLGSSQANAQIDENVLNSHFAKRLWITELAFPGTTGFDLFCNIRRLQNTPASPVFCYVSEQTFYLSVESEGTPFFFSARDFSAALELGLGSRVFDRAFGYAILGDFVPVFRCRSDLGQRILGKAFQTLPQLTYDAGLESDLKTRALKMKPLFSMGSDSAIHKNAFRAFVRECQRQNRTLIVLEGQVSPILSSVLDPSIRTDMLNFLQTTCGQQSNVILVQSSEMPPQAAADYKDLTHVNKAAQQVFTSWLIGWIEKNLPRIEPSQER